MFLSANTPQKPLHKLKITECTVYEGAVDVFRYYITEHDTFKLILVILLNAFSCGL